MRYCKKCVQPDTRPGIKFNADGICPPCEYMESLGQIDWQERGRILKEIVAWGKKTNVSGYDCIIGVSGGKDSTRQALYVREALGLKPLLVCCAYPSEQQTEIGAHNISNLTEKGFDTVLVYPSAVASKKMVRDGFFRYGNWAKATEMCLYASLPKMAIAYHIPLVFLGENPALNFGEMGVRSMNWDANRFKYANTISSGPDVFLNDEIKEQSLAFYRMPSDEEMQMANLQFVYLGYFWKDFTKIDNAAYSVSYGMEIRDDRPENMGDIYPFDAIDEDFMLINQMFKYIKYGFGKVSDQVCELIRWGKMSREKAVELVNEYDGKCADHYIKRFCDYLQITQEEFWRVVETYRGKDVWTKGPDGQWQLKVRLT